MTVVQLSFLYRIKKSWFHLNVMSTGAHFWCVEPKAIPFQNIEEQFTPVFSNNFFPLSVWDSSDLLYLLYAVI